jgi:predicted metalloprotease with PDZ domain
MREVPFEEFVFLYHLGSAAAGGGGGMEHMNSTAIHSGAALSVAGVSAHEFFHLWNVKRIRPKTLEPVDYARENWTRSLWFAEGVTSTYTSFTLVRSGLWTPQQFYGDLGGQITSLQRRPARLWKSVEEASLDAWLEKYTGYARPEYSISYYNKGQLLGLLLDVLIRNATNNRKSLDDVMRHLNTTFARKAQFYDERTDLRAAVERVAGQSFEEFFRKYVNETSELPYAEILSLAGMKVDVQGAMLADLGFRVERPVAESRVSQVQKGSEAELAGVQQGDTLVAVNGQPPPANVTRWLRQQKPGDSVRLSLRRGSALREVEFKLGQERIESWSVDADPAAGEKARRVREGVLTGKTD